MVSEESTLKRRKNGLSLIEWCQQAKAASPGSSQIFFTHFGKSQFVHGDQLREKR